MDATYLSTLRPCLSLPNSCLCSWKRCLVWQLSQAPAYSKTLDHYCNAFLRSRQHPKSCVASSSCPLWANCLPWSFTRHRFLLRCLSQTRCLACGRLSTNLSRYWMSSRPSGTSHPQRRPCCQPFQAFGLGHGMLPCVCLGGRPCAQAMISYRRSRPGVSKRNQPRSLSSWTKLLVLLAFKNFNY